MNQKETCFVVLLPLKQNSLHSAALTQNASACRNMQFQPGGLFTLGRSGRRWVARGNATGLAQKNGGSVYSLPTYLNSQEGRGPELVVECPPLTFKFNFELPGLTCGLYLIENEPSNTSLFLSGLRVFIGPMPKYQDDL